jgi:hypothetical protein
VAAAVTGRTAFCGAVGMLMLRSSLKVPLRLVCAAILRAVPATAAVAGTIALSDLVLGKGLASAVAAAVVGVPIYFLVLHLTARSTFMALRDSVFAAIGRSGAAAAAPPGAQR